MPTCCSRGAKQKNASAEVRIAAIDEGVAAIDSRVLDYNPKRDDKPEGLKFGPNASKEKKERRDMAQRLAPAVDFLVGYARKVFTLRAKDKALKAALSRQAEKEDLFAETVRKMRDSLKREQDKTRARGDAVVKAFEALKKTAPAPILAMFFPSKARFNEETFPDAWAVPSGAKPDRLERHLAAMPNLTLWKIARENYNAELLSDEDPHLQSRYQAGLKAIHKEAADRGFDLKDGRHYPSKAKDPMKAQLHADGNPVPIHVKKRDSERIRTRTS